MNTLKRAALISLVIIAILYPFLVYWGIQRFEPKFIGLAIAVVYFLRILIVAKKTSTKCLSAVGISVFTIALWYFNHPVFLTTLPALISLGGFIVFTHSLIEPPTIPARFAKRIHGELSPARLRYTSQITKIWMAFFLLNSLTALYTAFYCSREIWTAYNGLISYLLMGCLFAGEYLYRHFIFERQLQHD